MESKTNILAQSPSCTRINVNYFLATATTSCRSMMQVFGEWVRSSTPRPMVLSLKKLQGILNMEQSMDNDCFNIVVHILACDEGVLFADPPIHYMDLQFCVNYQNSSFNIISINMFLNSFLLSP
uniref:Uncharacterized protein n=2 Tax=Aegilops tauschii subsp. strangulata TaxID=200361 RepID=A0A453BUH4_AEGTS